jgi:biopolymer transport protein ExbB/TolQ
MLNWGQSPLQLLGVTAPTVGFVGTLVGLIQSFRKLGTGGDINNVISGLGLSMTTSLIGAVISVVFLTVAWILGAAQLRFERSLDQIIASQQAGYQSVI